MKRITCFILYLIVVSGLHADFKIMGGMNLSKYRVLSETEGINWNNKLGFLAGIGLEKDFAPHTILEFDILYFVKGCQVEIRGNSPFKYDLRVLSLPFMLKIKLLEETSPYVVGGIELSYILSHKIKLEKQAEVDLKENTRSFDYGFVVGFGFELKIEEHLFLFIEARYHQGKVNLISNPGAEESMFTRSILAVLGVKS
jgi:opacity protein-like surface antigen